jgi:hypothetical protein
MENLSISWLLFGTQVINKNIICMVVNEFMCKVVKTRK